MKEPIVHCSQGIINATNIEVLQEKHASMSSDIKDIKSMLQLLQSQQIETNSTIKQALKEIGESKKDLDKHIDGGKTYRGTVIGVVFALLTTIGTGLFGYGILTEKVRQLEGK
jgi:hypothetical protein